MFRLGRNYKLTLSNTCRKYMYIYMAIISKLLHFLPDPLTKTLAEKKVTLNAMNTWTILNGNISSTMKTLHEEILIHRCADSGALWLRTFPPMPHLHGKYMYMYNYIWPYWPEQMRRASKYINFVCSNQSKCCTVEQFAAEPLGRLFP